MKEMMKMRAEMNVVRIRHTIKIINNPQICFFLKNNKFWYFIRLLKKKRARIININEKGLSRQILLT